MTKLLERVYLSQDAAALPAIGLGGDAQAALRLHWEGNLKEAAAAYERLGETACGLLTADRILVNVKIGLGLPRELPVLRTALARAVLSYAMFSHFFWISHAQAWRAIFAMARAVTVSGHLKLLTVPMFLAGHLLAIAGRSWIGLPLATLAYNYVVRCERRGRPLSPLGKNIVFAAYPYTLFVSASLGNLEVVVSRSMSLLGGDPYYQAIFLVSQLYCFAYTGQVARAEILAEIFSRLHQGDRLVRYRPLAAVMGLLPLALRGYADLVQGRFSEVLAAHDPAMHDPMINSHVFRAAALIYLALNRHDDAQRAIEQAMVYRADTGSFVAWIAHDRKILNWAKERQPFDPRRHRLLSQVVTVDTIGSLGSLLMRAITLLPNALRTDPRRFADEIAAILQDHIGWQRTTLLESPMELDRCSPQIKIGEYYLVFDDLPPDRMPFVENVLSAVAPAVRAVEQALVTMRRLQAENERASVDVAIAAMTQMIVHDVRKPFSMLKLGLDRLQSVGDDPQEVRDTAGRIQQHVGKALDGVNGMLSDVLEVGGSKTNLLREPSSLAAILSVSVRNAFQYDAASRVSLGYQLDHRALIDVDQLKVQRVLTNLLENARQALRGKDGRIWIRSKAVEVGGVMMVEVTVGNSGPLIAKDDQPHLFEAFYTRGKRGGTGLGLAICKKVVMAHGGTILCRSSESTGTEFVLTLPLASGLQDQASAALPASSEEVRAAFQAALQLDSAGKSNSDALRVQGIVEAARRLGRPLEVLVVDDEALYGEGIRGMLTRVQELSGHVRMTTVMTPGAALEACKDFDFDLAICDLDLDDSARSGLALVERLRSRCPKLQICVHSNRSGVDEYREAIHAGADAFLPKPMSRSHLLGLLQRGSMH